MSRLFCNAPSLFWKKQLAVAADFVSVHAAVRAVGCSTLGDGDADGGLTAAAAGPNWIQHCYQRLQIGSGFGTMQPAWTAERGSEDASFHALLVSPSHSYSEGSPLAPRKRD